jgi:hypothetical protein
MSFTGTVPAGSTAMSRYEFIGCVDITGDGHLEIVLYSRQFERDGVEVFTFDGKTARRVLGADWGV